MAKNLFLKESEASSLVLFWLVKQPMLPPVQSKMNPWPFRICGILWKFSDPSLMEISSCTCPPHWTLPLCRSALMNSVTKRTQRSKLNVRCKLNVKFIEIFLASVISQ